MTTVPPPTSWQFTPYRRTPHPNLTNSLLILVRMIYVYFITHPNIITLPAIKLNSPVNSFCPLEKKKTLVLCSDNFLFIFPPFTPIFPQSYFFSGPDSKLPLGDIYTVCLHTFILLWLPKTSVRVEKYQLNFLVLF